jgi:hypothetical protein
VTRIFCPCGHSAYVSQRLPDLPMFSLAFFPDPSANKHTIFTAITPTRDARGNIWYDFNGGAESVCAICMMELRAEGTFRDHDFKTCEYADCAAIRHAWRRRCQAAGR